MKAIKMILKDGTEIALKAFVLPMHVVLTCDTKEEMLDVWNQFRPENLEEVKILEDDEVLFTFLYAGVTGQQSIVNTDGTITVHFYLDGEREPLADPEYDAAARILLGEVE